MVMTIREVARVLKVSEKTCYRLVKTGELEHIWVRGTIRVPTEAVVIYIRKAVKKGER